MFARQRLRAFAPLILLAAAMPLSATPVSADVGATVPSGFRDRLVWDGLTDPTAVSFAPGGKVFVAQKDGRIQVFDSLNDPTPTQFANLSSDVFNYWDRGLLGMVADPDPSKPYVYVLYTYDHILGDAAAAPRWGGVALADGCPSPPGGNTDGCLVSGRLERLTVDGDALGARKVLITDWCQQYPSHSIGSLAFGPEGALYVSGGDGASFNGVDYGQLGGTQGNPPPTPVDPCDDPTNEGGALRSQDTRTSADPTSLDGSILRVDPATGAAWPGNANASSGDANKRRIIASGLRNPFRITVRPDGHVWIGDVGWNTWEEINEITDPDATPRNFGWPCFEGTTTQPAYHALNLPICTGLTSQSPNAFKYNHALSIVSGDGCGTGSSAVSGIAFRGTAGVYPTKYDNGLFFSDYSRKCIWFVPDNGGTPNFAAVERLADLNRVDVGETDGGAVSLAITPEGNVLYTDLSRDEVRQIVYDSANPPNAAFTASTTAGTAPLDVSFDGNPSSDPNGDSLTYAWDLDGDGQYDDATGITAAREYTDPGPVTVRLRVTDEDGLTDTASKVITVGNGPPSVSIDAPTGSSTWSVGDEIAFSGSATDPQDGTVDASRFTWTVILEHCPSDCHEHTITSFPGVTSGSFIAPNHDYPSHLRLQLKVTDEDGLSTTVSRDLQPNTGAVSAVSHPAGIMLTVAGVAGAPPPASTGIAGGGIDVSAPASVAIGEATFTFDAWSDGGARNHTVTVGSGSSALTASYTAIGDVDAPGACAAAVPGAPSSAWRQGEFQTDGDADWYRFTNTSTRSVEITLGDLPVDASLRLYRGCTTLVSTSDRSGTHTEQTIESLKAGTYAVKVTNKGGATNEPYVLRIRRLASGLSVRSATSHVEEGAGTLALVGEVWNEYATTRGPITVTAKLYDAEGHLLTTRRATTVLYAVSHSRAGFRIDGSLPDGFDHAVYSVSAPKANKTARGVSYHTTAFAPVASRWRAVGTIKASRGAVKYLKVSLTLYDRRGNVIDVVRGTVGKSTLAKNKSTTYVAWSKVVDPVVDRAKVRTFGFRP
jgi:glucose/arabinose dehydrogenase